MKDLIIIGLTLTALYKTYKYRANWEYHALLWVAILCALGYRAFPSSNSDFQIHPIDLVLFLSLLKISTQRIHLQPPIILKILILICFAGVILAIVYPGYHIYWALSEAKSFMLIYPSFLLAGCYVNRNRDMLKFNFYYCISMSIVALLAIIEFYIPSITGYFLGIYQDAKETELWELEGAQFFERARFTNWGAATAGHIIVLAIPLIWSLKNTIFFANSLVYYFVLASLVWAVYISGARADWIILVLFSVLYFLLYSRVSLNMNKFVTTILGAIAGFIILTYTISSIAINRFLTGLVALKGEADIAKDSSGYIRKMRLQEAWENVMSHPFGIGWGNSGWVHADIVQFTANMGWVPGILFISLYFSIMTKGFLVLSKMNSLSPNRRILAGLWIANISTGFQFATNGIYNLTQTGVPFFIMLGLLHYFTLKMQEKKKVEIKDEAETEVKVEEMRLGVEG